MRNALAAQLSVDSQKAGEPAAGIRQPVKQRTADHSAVQFGDDQEIASRTRLSRAIQHLWDVLSRYQRLGREVRRPLHQTKAGDGRVVRIDHFADGETFGHTPDLTAHASASSSRGFAPYPRLKCSHRYTGR